MIHKGRSKNGKLRREIISKKEKKKKKKKKRKEKEKEKKRKRKRKSGSRSKKKVKGRSVINRNAPHFKEYHNVMYNN